MINMQKGYLIEPTKSIVYLGALKKEKFDLDTMYELINCDTVYGMTK